MKIIYALFLGVLTLSTPCLAQTNEGEAPTIEINMDILDKSQISELIAGKTFWPVRNEMRVYFGENGDHAFQSSTEIKNGKWDIKDDQLCLYYKGVLDACHIVMRGPEGLRVWGQYDDPIYLFKTDANGSMDATPIYLNRWMFGNLILEQEFFNALPEMVGELYGRKSQVDAHLNNSIKTEASPKLAQYKQDITDKLMILPFGGVINRADGTAVTLSQQDVIDNRGDFSVFKNRKADSIWFIDGEDHCWITTVDINVINCQRVYANGESLNTRISDYVMHTENAFTRTLPKAQILDIP